MSWQRYDDSGQRWTWDGDEERHLLLFVPDDGELYEYHEVPDGAPAVHFYTTERVHIPRDSATPLDGAEHAETFVVAGQFAPWVRALDDFELWDWLATGKYRTATGAQG